MIHKAVIVLLVAAGMATLALWVATFWQWPLKTACVAHNWLACSNNPGFGLVFAGARLDAAESQASRQMRPLRAARRIEIDQFELEFRDAYRKSRPSFSAGTVRYRVGPLRVRRGDFVHYALRDGRGIKVLVPMTYVVCRRWAFLLLTLLALSYPTLAFIRGPLRRWRRRRKGLCVKCGYNLTGNVSGVCPECGEAV